DTGTGAGRLELRGADPLGSRRGNREHRDTNSAEPRVLATGRCGASRGEAVDSPRPGRVRGSAREALPPALAVGPPGGVSGGPRRRRGGGHRPGGVSVRREGT